MKYLTDAAKCSQFYSTAKFTLHVSGVLHWFVPVTVDTVKNCTPDDGCVKHPKHVE